MDFREIPMKKNIVKIIVAILLAALLVIGYIYISKNNYEKADLSETKSTQEETLTWKEITTTQPTVYVEENIPDNEGWGPIK